MLTTKKGKSILRCRWGKPRQVGKLMRVDPIVVEMLRLIPECDRRAFVTRAIKAALLNYQHK